ncbi:Tetratricopeptide repeat protein [Azospirillaceae bacterium]
MKLSVPQNKWKRHWARASVGLALIAVAASVFISSVALALTQDEVRQAYYRSYTYERMASYEDAIKALIPVFDAYPEGYTVNLRLGWLYYLRGNYANAIEHYRKAGRLSPLSLEARLGLLNPLIAQDRVQEAIDLSRQILEIDRYNYTANLRMVTLLRRQGKRDIAERLCLDVLAVYPADVLFLAELGQIKADLNQTSSATAIFNDVLTLDPENIVAKRYLKQNSP